ncbi:MAG TPA: FxsA family protein [Enhygromyxa sp.]|nr:FxsA family protein [Enhygromyxa sp.]
MLGRLFLLFTLVPLAEIYLLVKLGGLLGVWPTIGLVMVTGFLGAALARREGRRALARYQEAMAKGQLPEEGIVSGLLILVGGVLLIAPGVLTDLTGLALMIPPVRRAVARQVKARVQRRISAGSIQVMHIGTSGFGIPGFEPGADRPEGEVIDAEIVDRREPSDDSSDAAVAPRKR